MMLVTSNDLVSVWQNELDVLNGVSGVLITRGSKTCKVNETSKILILNIQNELEISMCNGYIEGVSEISIWFRLLEFF